MGEHPHLSGELLSHRASKRKRVGALGLFPQEALCPLTHPFLSQGSVLPTEDYGKGEHWQVTKAGLPSSPPLPPQQMGVLRNQELLRHLPPLTHTG